MNESKVRKIKCLILFLKILLRISRTPKKQNDESEKNRKPAKLKCHQRPKAKMENSFIFTKRGRR